MSRCVRAVIVVIAVAQTFVSGVAASVAAPLTDLDRQAQAIGRELFRSHIGPRVQDNIPLVASSGSFTFTFNRELDVWERERGTSGPILLERAETLGTGKFDINVNYGYLKFKELNGRSLDSGLSKIDENGVKFTYDVSRAEAQIIGFTFIYGVAENADVSLVIPLERLAFAGRFVLDPPVLPASATASEEHFGVGDIELRGKWRALRSDWVDVAAGLDLKMPSGDTDKGLRVGDTRLGVLTYLSHTFLDGTLEPHLNLGVEVNLAEARDSRLFYGAGVTYQLWASGYRRGANVGFTVDLIGKADLMPPEDRDPGSFFGAARQRNILDVAPGLKLELSAHVLLFGAVEVPLTSDDLRTDFTPIGGVEVIL